MHMTDDPSFALVLLADATVPIVAPFIIEEGKSVQRTIAGAPSQTPCPIRIDTILRKSSYESQDNFT